MVARWGRRELRALGGVALQGFLLGAVVGGALTLALGCGPSSTEGTGLDSAGPLVPAQDSLSAPAGDVACLLADGSTGGLWCPDVDGDGLGDLALACAPLCLPLEVIAPIGGPCSYVLGCTF